MVSGCSERVAPEAVGSKGPADRELPWVGVYPSIAG
jgi:hypothetical protein